MSLHTIVQKAQGFASKNSPAIMTGLAVAGVVGTVYFTATGTFKAAELIEEERSRVAWETIEDPEPVDDLEPVEKIRLVWKCYIPAAVTFSGTVAAIIFLNQIGARRAATATALYTITDKAFAEYKDKVVETIGEKKEQKIRDDIAQDRVKENPPTEVVVAGSGDVLFYDTITGRYFNSTMEAVRKAQNDINYTVINNMYASLSEFYDAIGLSPTSFSEDCGWNADALMDISFSTVLSEDNRPCISIDYTIMPIKGYNRLV